MKEKDIIERLTDILKRVERISEKTEKLSRITKENSEMLDILVKRQAHKTESQPKAQP